MDDEEVLLRADELEELQHELIMKLAKGRPELDGYVRVYKNGLHVGYRNPELDLQSAIGMLPHMSTEQRAMLRSEIDKLDDSTGVQQDIKS